MTEYVADRENVWPYGSHREEIVRCRDCKYNAKDTNGICYRFDHEHFNQPNDFCSWGKRREDA